MAELSVLLAGILWGVINIFVKTLSAHGMDPLQISAVRMTVAAVVFTIFVLIKDRSLFRIRLKDIWIFAGTGIVSIVLFNTCYFYTVVNSQACNGEIATFMGLMYHDGGGSFWINCSVHSIETLLRMAEFE